MFKKILFWLYVVGGPLLVIFLTIGEALWPVGIPFDYLFFILLGFFTFMISVILMTNKKLNLRRKRVLYIFIPLLVYIGLLPLGFSYLQNVYNFTPLIRFFIFSILFYAIVTHITVIIYKHWIVSKDSQTLIDQPTKKIQFPKTKKFLNKLVKVTTLSFLMFIIPFIWAAFVITFSSEWRIRFEIYVYQQDPSVENLTDLTIDLLNYRSYEERLIYLPLALNNDEVLNSLFEHREDSVRAELYGVTGETNLSYILEPEDTQLLIKSQILNAYLLLDRNTDYLNLIQSSTDQYTEHYFYYLFLANRMMFSLEFKPILPDLLILMEQVYDHYDVNDKSILFIRMLNIRTRQTIYFIQDDQANDDRLEVTFNQLVEELVAYKASLEDK